MVENPPWSPTTASPALRHDIRMDLANVLSALQIEQEAGVIAPGWAESSQARPPGEVFFLEDRFVQQGCGYLGIPTEMEVSAVRVAGAIRRDAALAALAWHAHWRMYHGGKSIREWPEMIVALGKDAGWFWFLVLLSNYPQTRAFHEAHAIPSDVVAETLGDVEHHLRMRHKLTGQEGIAPIYAGGWLRHHMKGEVFKLGRLQFIPSAFTMGQRVFRHRGDGRIITLAEGGLVFRRDGQRNGASGITEEEGSWTSRGEIDAGSVVGNPVETARGAVVREAMHLPLSDWTEILKPGDPVLDIHIPAGGPLSREDAIASMQQALAFFSKHFPKTPSAKALVCTTWLLDAQLASFLKPDSNILGFQRLFHLYPVECDAWSAFRFVFNLEIPYGQQAPPDLLALPRKSALERALIEHVEAGGRWRKAGGYLLVADLP